MKPIFGTLAGLTILCTAPGCLDAGQGAVTPTQVAAMSLQSETKLYYVRNRTAEVRDLTPEARRAFAQEATRALFSRARSEEGRNAMRFLLDPSGNSRIYAVPGDSMGAELVSLVYSIQDVERRERKRAGQW